MEGSLESQICQGKGDPKVEIFSTGMEVGGSNKKTFYGLIGVLIFSGMTQ